MLKHITLEEAVALMSQQPVRVRTETIGLDEALDRIVAEDIVAQRNVPPFNKSCFDGYAYYHEDAPGVLKVAAEVVAGADCLQPLERWTCVRIYTGAPIPSGADAVIKQENVVLLEGAVRLKAAAVAGENIVAEGEDISRGDVLIKKGTKLLPAHLGILAGQGLAQVKVYCKPKAVLIPTGSELAAPGERCGNYGIYNSSSSVLCGYMVRMGLAVAQKDIVPDEKETVFDAVQAAVRSDADVIFTTGGASVGDYDFAKNTAERLGADILFWKIHMKPGGALMVSQIDKRLLINLSGNPAAALMSLLVVLRPWLSKLVGSEDLTQAISLPLKEDMPKTGGATRILRGHLEWTDRGAVFAEHKGRGNGNIASFAGCELLGIIAGGQGPLEAGERIRVLRLPAMLC